MTFLEIIAPISIEEFFNEYYEKKPLHIKRDDPHYYCGLISLNELDLYMQLKGTYASNVKVAYRGEEVSPHKFSKEVTGIETFNAQPDKLYNLYQQGHTLKYDKLHHTYPPLAQKISDIEKEIGMKIRTSVYITPENSQGYGMHTDRHDVLALQLNGTKTWRIAQSSEFLPSHYLAPIDVDWERHDNIETIKLNSGDFFYCPRGLAHDVYTEDSSSTHFTLGLKPVYRYQLLDQLGKKAYAEQFFRYSIPTKFESEASIDQFKKAWKLKFNELIDNVTVDELIQLSTNRLSYEQLNMQLHKFHKEFYEPNNNDEYVVSSQKWQLTSEKIVLKASKDNKTYNLPTIVKSDLDRLLKGGRLSIATFGSQLSTKQRRKLFKRLIKIGFIKKAG